VEPIAIYTDDFRLSFRLVGELKRRGVLFDVLDFKRDPKPSGIWLGSNEEVANCIGIGRGIGVSIETVNLSVERAVHLARGLDSAVFLTFGIDPGPRPGIAWLSDGVLVGTAQLEFVDDVIDHILAIASLFEYDRLRVKIGDGSPVIEVQIVDEKQTSKGPRHKSHATAAIRIAMLKGFKVMKKRHLEVTNGEIKELQRRSRTASNGRLTIASDLSRSVAVGRLSLDEAIDIQIKRSH
jgi:hypothetical protein